MKNNAKVNTDRELWKEPAKDFTGIGYEDSIHVTEHGGIGIKCGGRVYVKPLKDWHELAKKADTLNETGGDKDTCSWGNCVRVKVEANSRQSLDEPPKPTKECEHCGGDIAIRNPTGKCDHLHYPENVTPKPTKECEHGEFGASGALGKAEPPKPPEQDWEEHLGKCPCASWEESYGLSAGRTTAELADWDGKVVLTKSKEEILAILKED